MNDYMNFQAMYYTPFFILAMLLVRDRKVGLVEREEVSYGKSVKMLLKNRNFLIFAVAAGMLWG